ncbi:hypothetical protein [Uliginosibacterium sp. H1]|uniref:hypothetical protein n=1 Tax=Uliginosibacterium sp. H1 TaxID=3114757 RepID=UPI002E17A751|nr:hypothetical protein [Uliginosibacterium sp. H1]
MTTELALFEAANGHLSLECGGLPDSYWQSVVELLEKEKGFSRSGKPVIGAGEMIHQSFVAENFSLSSGWDNWSGHHLLAESDEGDHFLRQLYRG